MDEGSLRRWRCSPCPPAWPRSIVCVSCRFGGCRPYSVCPGVVNGIACDRRVAKLYQGGRYFLCRHCYGLAYASQREARMDRDLRKANKIRVRLGGDPGMAARFPDRPALEEPFKAADVSTLEIPCCADEIPCCALQIPCSVA